MGDLGSWSKKLVLVANKEPNWGTDPKKELKDPQIQEFWSGNEDLRSKFSGSDNGSEFRSLPPFPLHSYF